MQPGRNCLQRKELLPGPWTQTAAFQCAADASSDLLNQLLQVTRLRRRYWNRRAISARVALSALGLQIGIGSFLLFVPWGRAALASAASAVNQVISYGNKGVEFMFGGLVGPAMHDLFGATAFVFAFKVLPAIIYMFALIAILDHTGLMRWIVAVTTIFLGQSEMPVALRPFAAQLRGPELFAIMSSGMASVAGSTLAGYAALGKCALHAGYAPASSWQPHDGIL
jgi:nucleoside permease NupC